MLSQVGIGKVILLSTWWQRWHDSVASKLNQVEEGKDGRLQEKRVAAEQQRQKRQGQQQEKGQKIAAAAAA